MHPCDVRDRALHCPEAPSHSLSPVRKDAPDRHARASPIRAQMVRHAANLDKVFAVADKAGSKLTQQIFEAHKGDAEITFKSARRPGRVGGTFSSASLDEDGHRGLV